ncbi:hypothetical protein IU399_25400 [Salmonella enterica subsp. enterica serovar Worthington]|nr:hypothetical protein [Salmonella enterica subsp. enterica serovar Worthington]
MTSNIMVSLPKSKPDYFTPKRQSAQAFLTIDADFRQLPEDNLYVKNGVVIKLPSTPRIANR